MLLAVAVTIDSIMKPVFGTPQATGVGPIGGMATQTPTENTFLKFRILLVLVGDDETAWIDQPSMPRNGAMPRKAGNIIEKPNGNSFVALTEPSSAISSTVILPGSTLLTRTW